MERHSVTVQAIPSITVFVRHSASCPRKGDEFFRGCKCTKHLRWTHAGKQHRQSARVKSWTEAEKLRRSIEAKYVNADPSKPAVPTVEAESAITIATAAQLYLSDKQSQGINPGVVQKYRRELDRFSEFMLRRSKHFPHEVELADLTAFRSGWEKLYPSSTTRAKVQERLRGFLRYCYEAKLIDRIPQMSAIKVDEPPTLPLSEEQYSNLLRAVPTQFPAGKAMRVYALIRLMRHSGLAIRDVVTLERDELQRDAGRDLHRIVTKRQKTGTHVSVPIPPDVAKDVSFAMELNRNARYMFWNTGTGKPQTAVTNWQHDLRQVFRAAGQPEGHPHQLRDTFAVSLLEKGVPLEEVSKLLGHESIKTTERYYAKWVKARQDRLDSLVMATWA